MIFPAGWLATASARSPLLLDPAASPIIDQICRATLSERTFSGPGGSEGLTRQSVTVDGLSGLRV